MKMILFTAMAALLLASAGCTSVNSSRNDEAKVVARILAKSATSPLAFRDQGGAQQLLSSLDTSEHFTFGVILDAKKKVFASYSRPDQVSEKERFLARVAQSVPTGTPETFSLNDGVAISMVRIGVEAETIGYVAVARKAQ
ncbi:MAG TPA: CHASE sensor domain-containing protein [Candidatus Saccharimonadales bacterium]|nr:CHASE sensor domain-containing protein [Candidatus Saccharimonadales bacterium]